MSKLTIFIMITILSFNISYAQALGHAATDKRSTIEKEFNTGYHRWANISNKDNGVTNVKIFFEDQSRTIYIKKIDLKNITIVKGDKTLPKYDNGNNLIYVPLEGDYILKNDKFTIESKYKKLYFNNKEILDSTIVIDEKRQLKKWDKIMSWEGRIHN